MEWVASTLHTTSELSASSITTADAHTSAASSRLNWRPCRFKPLNAELYLICHLLALLGAHHILHVSRIRVKWTRSFRRKTKSGFCACAITFQTQSPYPRISHRHHIIIGDRKVKMDEGGMAFMACSFCKASWKSLCSKRIHLCCKIRTRWCRKRVSYWNCACKLCGMAHHLQLGKTASL